MGFSVDWAYEDSFAGVLEALARKRFRAVAQRVEADERSMAVIKTGAVGSARSLTRCQAARGADRH